MKNEEKRKPHDPLTRIIIRQISGMEYTVFPSNKDEISLELSAVEFQRCCNVK